MWCCQKYFLSFDNAPCVPIAVLVVYLLRDDPERLPLNDVFSLLWCLVSAFLAQQQQ